jgi:hypothetical protein
MTPPRFPHSDIHGSRPACGSPWLFAACHVLLRFPAPRHPPSALSSLTTTLLRRSPLPLSRCFGERSPGYSRVALIRLSKNVARHSVTRESSAVFALPCGGDDRIRTGDPLLAKQVLSQLSYIPADKSWWAFLGSNQGPRAYQARALAT